MLLRGKKTGLSKNGCTLWKINMEPGNDDLEDDFPFQMGDLEVSC